MTEKAVKINNSAGIHCRPASVILNTIMEEFPEHVFTVIAPGHEPVELNSILSLIALGLQNGDEIILRVEGSCDTTKACEKIAELFAHNFDFPNAQPPN